MAGRKPTPTMLKLFSGTLRKPRLNPAEPQPVGDLLVPPDWMDDEQKAEWAHALDNSPSGLLRRLDRNMFAQWCVASTDAVEHILALRVEGKMIERGGAQRTTIDKDGKKTTTVRSPIKVNNPRVKMLRDAVDRMLKLESTLGFSPTSRSRITLAGGGKKETNRFANNAARRA